MRSILLLVDLEGMIGINSMRENISRLTQLASAELHFVISKLCAAGFLDITIADIHNEGKVSGTIDFEPYNVKVIQGINNLVSAKDFYDCAIMLGFHGRSNSGGLFDHTFRLDIEKCFYGNKNIGEVGAYFRWLNLKGISVAMVSGEGNFLDELKDFPCIIHAIKDKPVNTEIIQYEYFCLEHSLDQAIYSMQNERLVVYDIPPKRVSIKVDNLDKYVLLRNCFGNIYMSIFSFDSLEDFFGQIYDFAMALNEAEKKIFEINNRFLNLVKNCNLDEEYGKQILHKYLKKDLRNINYLDRMDISQKLGLDYEDIIISKAML